MNGAAICFGNEFARNKKLKIIQNNKLFAALGPIL